MILHCQWRAGKSYPAPPKRKLRKLIETIIALAGGDVITAASVSFLSPKAMAEINEAFLGHTGSTDVICFDYRTCGEPADEGDPETPQVELFLCPDVAAREAAKRDLPYSRELTLYIAHGFLHAAGYDDLQPELKRKMRRAEKRVMSAIPEEFDGLFPEA